MSADITDSLSLFYFVSFFLFYFFFLVGLLSLSPGYRENPLVKGVLVFLFTRIKLPDQPVVASTGTILHAVLPRKFG